MMRNGVIVVAAAAAGWVALATAGCAKNSRPERASAAAVAPTTSPATQPSPDDPSYFTLEQIVPVPKLPRPKPRATTGPAPLDALQSFAQGHAALARGDRNTAINVLEK